MFLLQLSVVTFPVERSGAIGAIAISGTMPKLSQPDLCRFAAGACAVPAAAGEAQEWKMISGHGRTRRSRYMFYPTTMSFVVARRYLLEPIVRWSAMIALAADRNRRSVRVMPGAGRCRAQVDCSLRSYRKCSPQICRGVRMCLCIVIV